MNKKRLYPAASVLILLITTLACATSSQTPPIQPPPVVDSNAIATAVAGTAQAAATQTASAYLFAPSQTGATVEQLSDGTAKYTDYDGGFEIVFPAGWLAVRPNSEEFDAALKKQGAVNSMLHDQMSADLAGYDADFDRLYAYALRPDIEKNVIFGFSKLAWDAADGLPIDSITMGELVKELEAPGGIPGFRADTAQVHEDTQVKLIEIGGRWMRNDGQGETISFYSVGIFFKPTSDSTVRIVFTFLQDYQTQISTDVKSIMNSIRMIEPQQ